MDVNGTGSMTEVQEEGHQTDVRTTEIGLTEGKHCLCQLKTSHLIYVVGHLHLTDVPVYPKVFGS